MFIRQRNLEKSDTIRMYKQNRLSSFSHYPMHYPESENQSDHDESLLEFPCEFPIKAFGSAAEDFDALVVSLIRRHAPDLAEGMVHKRLSSGGRYMSVTVTIRAQSRAQLDAIYQELTGDSRIVMAL